jgi:hypothetical protein
MSVTPPMSHHVVGIQAVSISHLADLINAWRDEHPAWVIGRIHLAGDRMAALLEVWREEGRHDR